MSKRNKQQLGRFKSDIYIATARCPVELGENFTKEGIDDLFKLAYPKGTLLFLDEEDNAWYIKKDGDGGWNANSQFAKSNIEKI